MIFFFFFSFQTGHPAGDLVQNGKIQFIVYVFSLPVIADQPCLLQYRQMVGDGGSRHVKVGTDVSRRLCSVPKQLKHRPPGGVGEGFEGFLKAHGGLLSFRELSK